MNGLLADAEIFATALLAGLEKTELSRDLLVCPPATLLADFSVLFADSSVEIGGQDCHAETSGAYTGELSAAMLIDCGASHVILGHSERRAHHQESDAAVAAKAASAIKAGLAAIICVGETLAEREAGEEFAVVARQLRQSVPQGADARHCAIAYEPVWAIGTGRTPTSDQIAKMHGHIRAITRDIAGDLAGARILYGGSVKPSNAAEILALPNVDGVLVGGASLNAEDFLKIATAG